MRFRKIRLQSQSFVGGGPRFFTPCWHRIEAVICPAFDHGEASESGGEIWIELRCLFEKLLGFQRSVAKHVRSIGVIVRLNEEQIGVRILCRPAIEPCFFVRGEFRLKSRGNFLREIGLNGEDVCQIAVVIFRPNVLVIVRVDQLHAYSDSVASATYASFQSVATPSALPISRALRTPSPRYDMTDIREITFKSPIFDRFVRISSCMPSAK